MPEKRKCPHCGQEMELGKHPSHEPDSAMMADDYWHCFKCRYAERAVDSAPGRRTRE